MARLLVLVLFAALVFALVDRVGLAPGGVGTRIEGSSVWREADQVEGHFERSGSLEGTWMVFGGDAGGQHNALAHATVAGLDLRHARGIAVRYPDIHLCKSPGASEAQGLIDAYSFVAANRPVRNVLREAVRLHDEGVRDGGERPCLRLRGSHLSLQDVRMAESGEAIPGDVVRAFGQVRFVLAEEAEITECEPLLR